MSILTTAYETSGNRGYQLDKLTKPIAIAMVAGNLYPEPEIPALYLLRNDNGLNIDIPGFVHPLVVSIKGQDRVVVDVRGFMPKKETGVATPRTAFSSDYRLAEYRAKFQLKWILDEPKRLLAVSSIPLVAYADWISGAFAGKINPLEILTLKILAGFYYYCQFSDSDELGALERTTIIGSLSRNLRLMPKDIETVIGDATPIKDLADFCEVVKEKTGSTRLNDLNPGLLINMLSVGWFGVNSKPIVSSAIEHPPTWMALVTMALQSRIHNKTRIAQAVNRAVGRSDVRFVINALDASIEHLSD